MQRSINSIRYLDSSELFSMIKRLPTSSGAKSSSDNNNNTSSYDKNFHVIDVRGNDFLGGHIKGCLNYPYSKLKQDPEYLDSLKNKLLDCGGSRDRESQATPIKCIFHCAMSQQRGPSAALLFLRSLSDEELSSNVFEIYILRGGFINWVNEGYGKDPTVTEDYLDYLWN